MGRLVAILALLARRGKDTPEGREASHQFDEVYRRAMSDWADPKNREALWSYAVEAVEKLRAPELLTDAFWQGLEVGLPGFRVVELLANENILRRLEDIEKRGVFPPASPVRRLLTEALTIVRASLVCPAIRDKRDHTDRLHMAEQVLFKNKADKH
jgi:hypothetical protein